jgi:exosortase
VAALAVLWLGLFWRLMTDWEVNPQYGYGWVVPILGTWLIWRRWPDRPTARHSGSPLAIALMIFAALALGPIRIVEEANPEWRLVLWTHGLTVLTASLGYLWFTGGGAAVRHFAMPLCFFLISIPWPSGIEQQMIQTLTRIVAAVSVEFAGLMGIAAVQHGNVIELSRGMVGVEEACSGVRSLQSSIMIALFAGEAFRCSLLRRIVLLGGGILFAFLLNLGRTAFLVWSAAKHGPSQITAQHDTAGLIAAVILFIVLWIVAKRWAGSLKESLPVAGYQLAPAWLAIVILAAIAIAELGTEAWYRSHERDFVAATRWSMNWPTNSPGFREVKVGDAAQALLRCSQSRGAAWQDENNNHCIAFFLEWHAGKNSSQLAKSHTPDICLAATGMKLVDELEPCVITVRNLKLTFRQYSFEQQGRAVFAYHCIWEDRVPRQAMTLREDWSVSSRFLAARMGKRHLGQQSLELVISGPATAEQAEAVLENELTRILQIHDAADLSRAN